MDLSALCSLEGRSELRKYQSCELQDTTFFWTLYILIQSAEHLTY